MVRVSVFATHPLAVAQYGKLLKSDADVHVVSNQEAYEIGIFDSQAASFQAVLTLCRLKFPSMRPVLVSEPCQHDECLRWLFRGICGLVTYPRVEADLLPAVHEVARGKLWFPRPVIDSFLEVDAAAHKSPVLTTREREVMELLLRRLSNREIAGTLGITERTAKFHVSNVLEKLHMTSRQDLSLKWDDWHSTDGVKA